MTTKETMTSTTQFPSKSDDDKTSLSNGSINESSITTNLSIPGFDPNLTWTSSEERSALLKADICILGFIVLLFVFMQFDRTNLSNALTGGLREDIHVTTKDINTATTLFTLGFVVTELPFNMINKKLGPERFLPVTMVLWGICTWAQVFMKDRRGLWALRCMIGALEGGYIPGEFSHSLVVL